MATKRAYELQEFMACKLPFDLLVNIFSRLSLHDIVQCKLVCKDLYNNLGTVISDPSFINLHHSRVTQENKPDFLVFSSKDTNYLSKLYLGNLCTSSENSPTYLDSMKVKRLYDLNLKQGYIETVGSSNGFICLRVHLFYGSVFHLCNPITRESMELPRSNFQTSRSSIPRSSRCGFAFDSINNTFKVINTCNNLNSKATEVEVFTLGTGTWRRVEDLDDCRLSRVKPVLVDGVLHWVTMRQPTKVVAMNIYDETFKKLQGPPKDKLGFFHTCLVSSCFSVIADDRDDWEIWCLKIDSWEMKQRITKHQLHDYGLRIIAGMSNGRILFQSKKDYSLHHNGDRDIRQIKIHGFGYYRSINIDALPHVGSLVTLKTFNH